MKPFRWNIKKREQLGRLIPIAPAEVYAGYIDDLATCAAKVVARSANRKLVFVGRSPESLFDYLSGVFEGTSYESRIDMLNISNRFRDIANIESELPASYQALKDHFVEIGIAPDQIIAEQNGVCFCDLVLSGGTFGKLFAFLQKWSIAERHDFPAVVGKLGFVGITRRTKTSPNTWRWQQHAEWVQDHNKLLIKNVSIHMPLWDYLGNRQYKVANTNYPELWADERILLPPRDSGNLIALQHAYALYCAGKAQKTEFAQQLAATQEVKEPWLRNLINELKRTV